MLEGGALPPQVLLKGLTKASAQRLQDTRPRRLHQYFYELRYHSFGCKHIGLSLDFSRVAKRKVGVGAISNPITNTLGWAPPQVPRDAMSYRFSDLVDFFCCFQGQVLLLLWGALFFHHKPSAFDRKVYTFERA